MGLLALITARQVLRRLSLRVHKDLCCVKCPKKILQR